MFFERVRLADDENISKISKALMERNHRAYKELAKGPALAKSKPRV